MSSNADVKLPYQPPLSAFVTTFQLEDICTSLQSNEFRLLKVEGLDDDGCLTASLLTQDLEAHLPYVAISYTWNPKDRFWYGDHAIEPKPVRINGKVILLADKISNFLYAAMKYGRSLLWIDAVCINQSNLKEKSHQVNYMGVIYSQATEVLTMLGSPNQDTDDVLDAANIFSKNLTYGITGTGRLMLKLHDLINGPYWTRTWVLQELTLAKSVLVCCGERTADLKSIKALGQQIRKDWKDFHSPRNVWKDFRYKVKSWQANTVNMSYNFVDDLASLECGVQESLLVVLDHTKQYRRCEDPRDVLYSRLSLASDSKKLIGDPDYTTKVEEVYKKFATNCITQTQSLSVITYANRTPMDLPTWTPDWSYKQRAWDDGKDFTELSKEMSLLRWTKRDLPRISSCLRELTVQGRVLGSPAKRDLYAQYVAWDANRENSDFSEFSEAFNEDEIPRKDDLLCILKDCRLPVHLRPDGDKHIIVGRFSVLRTYGLEVGLKSKETSQSQSSKSEAYHFASLEATQAIPERIFIIT